MFLVTAKQMGKKALYATPFRFWLAKWFPVRQTSNVINRIPPQLTQLDTLG
jgi:hypothetical protein